MMDTGELALLAHEITEDHIGEVVDGYAITSAAKAAMRRLSREEMECFRDFVGTSQEPHEWEPRREVLLEESQRIMKRLLPTNCVVVQPREHKNAVEIGQGLSEYLNVFVVECDSVSTSRAVLHSPSGTVEMVEVPSPHQLKGIPHFAFDSYRNLDGSFPWQGSDGPQSDAGRVPINHIAGANLGDEAQTFRRAMASGDGESLVSIQRRRMVEAPPRYIVKEELDLLKQDYIDMLPIENASSIASDVIEKARAIRNFLELDGRSADSTQDREQEKERPAHTR